jgi:hypothetical protein
MFIYVFVNIRFIRFCALAFQADDTGSITVASSKKLFPVHCRRNF